MARLLFEFGKGKEYMTEKDLAQIPGSLEKEKSALKQSNEKKCKPVSYEDVSFTEKPDSGDTERIDAHSLFSMFTANMIKKQIKWFR